MGEADALAAFGALANADRLTVLRTLVRAGPEGMKAGGIAQAVNARPSRTSFHLTALADAGLVQSERQSRQILYRIRYDRIGQLIRFLMDDCCAGSDEVRRCCGL